MVCLFFFFCCARAMAYLNMVTEKMELANSLKEHYNKLLEELKTSKAQQARLMSQKHASLESRLQDTEKKLSRADAAAQEAKEAAAQANKDADERHKEAKLLQRDFDELKTEMFESKLADMEEVDEMRGELVLVKAELQKKERHDRKRREMAKHRCPPAVTTVVVAPPPPPVWNWRCRTPGCGGYWVGICAQMHWGPVYCPSCRYYHNLPCYCGR